MEQQNITESQQNLTGMPEWKERILELAINWANENAVSLKLARYPEYFQAEVEAAGKLIETGADFARNQMQQEIDALNLIIGGIEEGAHEWKDECGRLKYQVDRLTRERDELKAETIWEKCGSELWKRQRDELIEALRELLKGIEGLPPLTAIAGMLEKQYSKATQILKRYDK